MLACQLDEDKKTAPDARVNCSHAADFKGCISALNDEAFDDYALFYGMVRPLCAYLKHSSQSLQDALSKVSCLLDCLTVIFTVFCQGNFGASSNFTRECGKFAPNS